MGLGFWVQGYLKGVRVWGFRVQGFEVHFFRV